MSCSEILDSFVRILESNAPQSNNTEAIELILSIFRALMYHADVSQMIKYFVRICHIHLFQLVSTDSMYCPLPH